MELLTWDEWLSRAEDGGLALLVLDQERTGLRSKDLRLTGRADLAADMIDPSGQSPPTHSLRR